MITFKEFLDEMAASDFNVKNVNGVYRAYDKKTRKSAAGAIPNKETHNGQEVDSIHKMVTSPEWRGKGAMTAIHQKIEKDLGRPLHPSTALTNDGFEFWKRYRPEAVKHDLRHHRDHLMGKHVETPHGPGTITSVGSRVAIATLHKNNWSTSHVSKNDLIKQGHIKESYGQRSTPKTD